MSRLEDQVSAYIKHGTVPTKWADPEPLPATSDPFETLRRENEQLKQALGVAACSLDCMTGLTGKTEAHRTHARETIRVAMGA